MEQLTIGRLAALGEVTVETVRYYQRRGLLAVPSRRRGEIRRYGDEDLEQLRFIRRAQDMGFALSEIEHLIRLRTEGQCQQTRAIVAERLGAIEQQIASLSSYRKDLQAWIAVCDRSIPNRACPSLQRLRADTPPI
jgi:MerR family mercuric resistance operon transcriptional regulator